MWLKAQFTSITYQRDRFLTKNTSESHGLTLTVAQYYLVEVTASSASTTKTPLCTPLRPSTFNIGKICYIHVKVTEWRSLTILFMFLEDIPVIYRCVTLMRHIKYEITNGENFPIRIASILVLLQLESTREKSFWLEVSSWR